MGYMIRQASVQDAEDIAAVHVKAWQETYTGILDATTIAEFSFDVRVKRWREKLYEEAPCFAAFQASKMIGFVVGGKHREVLPPFKGEIYAIYLLQAYQGKGIGLALWESMREFLIDRDFSPYYVWVLQDNHRARNFYKQRGGQLLSFTKTWLTGRQEYLEVCYGFLT